MPAIIVPAPVQRQPTSKREKARQRADRGHAAGGTGLTPERAPARPGAAGNGILAASCPRVWAPAAIIAAELYAGREWDPVTSDDGVETFIRRRLDQHAPGRS